MKDVLLILKKFFLKKIKWGFKEIKNIKYKKDLINIFKSKKFNINVKKL